jgi:hypothetical protein
MELVNDHQFPMPREGFVATHFITSRDVERSAAFYRDVLGGEVVTEGRPTTRGNAHPGGRGPAVEAPASGDFNGSPFAPVDAACQPAARSIDGSSGKPRARAISQSAASPHSESRKCSRKKPKCPMGRPTSAGVR